MKYQDFMESCRREFIRDGLERHGGNVNAFAAEAGLNRAWVYELMEKYSMPRRKYGGGNAEWHALGMDA